MYPWKMQRMRRKMVCMTSYSKPIKSCYHMMSSHTQIDHVTSSKWKNSLLDVKCEEEQMLGPIISC